MQQTVMAGLVHFPYLRTAAQLQKKFGASDSERMQANAT